jgi:hypothetical protein
MPLTHVAAAPTVVSLHRIGRKIEEKDHVINVLQHDAWVLVNRMQERHHEEDLEKHRRSSKSLFADPSAPPARRSAAAGGAARSAGPTEEETRQAYDKKQKELKSQIKEVVTLRKELTALRDKDAHGVSLPELVRPHVLPCTLLFTRCPRAHRVWGSLHRSTRNSRRSVRATKRPSGNGSSILMLCTLGSLTLRSGATRQ